MTEPLEELQKRLEEATQPRGPGEQSPPLPDTPPLDLPLAEWKKAWAALGQLLDSVEQTLPEPAWTLPAETLCSESSAQPTKRFSRAMSGFFREAWFRGVAAAVVVLGLIGGLVIWGTRSLKSPEEAPVASTKLHASGQGEPCGSSSGPNHPPEPPTLLSKTGVPPGTPPSPELPSPDSSPQDTFPWNDHWEEMILSVSQASLAIEGGTLWEEDAFAGIRQKIAELQTELEQNIL